MMCETVIWYLEVIDADSNQLTKLMEFDDVIIVKTNENIKLPTSWQRNEAHR